MATTHQHSLIPVETTVPLYKYVMEDGLTKNVADTGYDTLKSYECTEPGCSYHVTEDLVRTYQ